MSDTAPPANLLMDALTPEDLRRVTPHLRETRLVAGDTVIRQGSLVHVVQFPTSAVLANTVELSDGLAVETAMVGREGVSGLVAFLAQAPIGWDVTVKLTGKAYEISADRLREVVEDSPTLVHLMFAATNDAQRQAAQNAACIAGHRIIQRLARSLLELADRTGDTTFALTQQELAMTLGAERTTVNAALGQLKQSGAVKQGRGRIMIADRALLQRASCECYATLGRMTLGHI